MMVSNRRFELWIEGDKFYIKSGDAFDIVHYLETNYAKPQISKSSLYLLKVEETKTLRATQGGRKLFVKCVR
jgi:hypothetical protein